MTPGFKPFTVLNYFLLKLRPRIPQPLAVHREYIYLLSGTLKRGRWAVSRKCRMIQKDNKHQKENFLLWDKHRKSWVLNIGPGIVPVLIAYQKAGFASSWLHWKNNKFKSISNERSKQPKFISKMTLLINIDLQWHLKKNGLIFFPT